MSAAWQGRSKVNYTWGWRLVGTVQTCVKGSTVFKIYYIYNGISFHLFRSFQFLAELFSRLLALHFYVKINYLYVYIDLYLMTLLI